MNIFNPKDRQAIQSQSFKELDNEIPLKGISKSEINLTELFRLLKININEINKTIKLT
jgi:hypothetical protein